MPYIKPEKRPGLNKVVKEMEVANVVADGDLNYILFKLCRETVNPSYQGYKNFIAELTECAAEIRRRFLAPYEDQKIQINGDV